MFPKKYKLDETKVIVLEQVAIEKKLSFGLKNQKILP